jgi:hypothetical protein
VNHRVSLTPAARGAGIRVVITTPWSARPDDFESMRFWRSRVEFGAGKPGHFNWNLVLGVVVMVGVSASFWTVLGLAISHVSK